MTMLSIGKKTE